MEHFRFDGMKRRNTGLAADKMVAQGMGLDRTYNLRKLLAHPDGRIMQGEDIASAALFKMTDTEFILQLKPAFHEEFQILRMASGTTVERGDSNVIGGYGYGSKKLSPSQLIFEVEDEAYSEVDRTIVGILCMKWILTKKYSTFTQGQHSAVKLKEEDFYKLRDRFLKTFGDTSSAYMLIVSMIVNDLGKSNQFRDLVKNAIDRIDKDSSAARQEFDEARNRWEIANHDEIIYFAAKLGALDLINEFDGDKRARLELGIQFGGLMNCGQLAQAENVPGSFNGIADLMRSDPDAFPMKFLEVVLDVAGAQGHVDSRSAKAWIAPVNTAYETARDCVHKVITGKLKAREAYDQILGDRAQLLSEKGWSQHLRTENPKERALLRLLLMARAANPKDAQKMADVLDSLPQTKQDSQLKDFIGRPIDNIQAALINGLTVDGTTDGIAIIPYYAPGLLAEIARVTKAEDEEIQKRALAAMLRLMTRAFVGTKSNFALGKGRVLECDLNFAQEIIRSSEFITHPEILDGLERQDKMYSDDVDALMKEFYGIRPLSRRGTAQSPALA